MQRAGHGEAQKCREMQRWQGVEVQRCRELLRCGVDEVHKCREVQRMRYPVQRCSSGEGRVRREEEVEVQRVRRLEA